MHGAPGAGGGSVAGGAGDGIEGAAASMLEASGSNFD
jgi:hypothetical protein